MGQYYAFKHPLHLDKLSTGQIVFFRYNYSPISALIRWFINLGHSKKCPYNHVGLVVFIWGVPFIVESVGRGVIATPAIIRLFNARINVKEYKKAVGEKNFAKIAVSYMGHTPYDWFGTFFHQVVFKFTGKWIGRKEKKADRRLYCSEYVAKVYNLYSKLYTKGREKFPEWERTDPRDIYFDDHLTEVYEGKVNAIL